MKKVKVLSKGYTIKVTSWENDGDNYKTKSLAIEDENLARAVVNLVKTLFVSCNNGEGGIGNSCEGRETTAAKELIVEYMTEHPELYPDKVNPSENDLIHICMNFNHSLMGGSEYYYSRVFEEIEVTYSSDDIFNEVIEFN